MIEFSESITLYADLLNENTVFDNVEVHPVCRIGNPSENEFEVCEPEHAEMWSVYIHLPEGSIECIVDCDTKKTAEALQKILLITGNMYLRN